MSFAEDPKKKWCNINILGREGGGGGGGLGLVYSWRSIWENNSSKGGSFFVRIVAQGR
jgi:hypothetical protein